MPDWLITLLNNPVAVTAIGGAVFIPFFKMLADIFMKRGPTPPPLAHDARDLPDHPLLVSAKVHLNKPELTMLTESHRRIREIDEECLPKLERRLDQVIDKVQLVNDRLDLLRSTR